MTATGFGRIANNKYCCFFGDGNTALNNGVGIYNGSSIPGYGKTILVAGHNNTYFNGLKYAKKNQKIKIRTSYGNYIYEITDVQIKTNTDKTAYDLSANHENLIKKSLDSIPRTFYYTLFTFNY